MTQHIGLWLPLAIHLSGGGGGGGGADGPLLGIRGLRGWIGDM